MSETLTIDTPDGAFQALVVRPAVEPAPVVVVIQEIFGVNDGIRQIAGELDPWPRVLLTEHCVAGAGGQDLLHRHRPEPEPEAPGPHTREDRPVSRNVAQ